MSESNESSTEKNQLAQQSSGQLTNVWDNLEPKRQLFAMKYVELGSWNAVRKALSMSYERCKELRQDPRVQALIAHQMEQLRVQSLVRPIMMERVLLDVIEIGLGEDDTFGVDKDGMQYNAKVTNLPAVNQAVATLHRMQTDREKIKIESEKSKAGGTVVINIENANFNSNRHFEMLAAKKAPIIETCVDVDTIPDAEVINGRH